MLQPCSASQPDFQNRLFIVQPEALAAGPDEAGHSSEWAPTASACKARVQQEGCVRERGPGPKSHTSPFSAA